MPKLSPLDDIKTYRDVADEAYARKFSQGIQNPKAALAARMAAAENPTPAAAAAPAASGMKFTKGFSPEERAAQAKALALKLKARDAEEAKTQENE